jgi:atypical dual specificity phosphatase
VQKNNSCSVQLPAKRRIKSDAFGPRNFLWLRKGQLAGTPRPGLMQDLVLDLEALKRVGVSVLVSLESEVDPIDPHELDVFGIKGMALPIKDMGSPSLDDAAALCAQIRQLIEKGESVAFHCKAGIGRTGTMLVANLIWEGVPALDALEYARKIEPRWVQSQDQVDFLERFEAFVHGAHRKSKEGEESRKKDNFTVSLHQT